MTEDLTAIGEQIRDRIDQHGMTPDDLAELAGVVRSTVYGVMNGKSRRRTALKVLEALEAWEEENGFEPKSIEEARRGKLITYRLRGYVGIDEITVEGPVENRAELAEAVADLIRQVNEGTSKDSPDK